jgi:hypothetical protein
MVKTKNPKEIKDYNAEYEEILGDIDRQAEIKEIKPIKDYNAEYEEILGDIDRQAEIKPIKIL